MTTPLPHSKTPLFRNLFPQSYVSPIFLTVFAALLFFPGLGLRDCWAPVEPRYAEIARVMLAKGEWIVPTVNGELYTDKPILYFWLVLVGSKFLGGVNEWTIRFPSALSALGLVFTTYYMGRDLLNPRVGLLASVVLATSARVLWEARWAHTDMTFTFFFTLSVYLLCGAIFEKQDRKGLLLAYALMGFATLTKGLIGVVLPGLIILAFVLARREWQTILKLRVLPGMVVFLLVTAPWFAAVSLATDGKWLEDFIWVHHIQRYTAGSGHQKPFFYYFANFPADFLPWALFAVPAIFAYKTQLKRLKEPVPLFLFLWFVVVFVFFSFSNTKRGLYLLPIVPPAAIFVARYFDDLTENRIAESSLYRWLALLFFNVLWVVSLSIPVVAWFLQKEAVGIILPFALMMAAGGLITLLAIRRRRPSWVFFSTAGTLLGGMICLAIAVLPLLDPYKSPRFFSLEVKKVVGPTEPLYIYGDTMNDFNFYTEREVIPVLSSDVEVKEVMSKTRSIYLLIRERDSKSTTSGRLKMLAKARVGDKRWFLVRLSKDEIPGLPE